MTGAPSKVENWYVVPATRWQMVNLVPLAHDRFQDVDRVLILRGSSASVPEAVAFAHADRTSEAFIQAVLHEASCRGWRQENIGSEIISGDMDDLAFWRGQVRDFFKKRANVASITFNYKGGPKDISLGVWLGLEQLAAEQPNLAVRFIAKLSRPRLYAGPQEIEDMLEDLKKLTN